jgi:sulfopyruvate decarboxylase TPP-binding subunit
VDSDAVNALAALSEIGQVGLLLLIMWQGLKRFDLLLQVIIELATRTKLTKPEIDALTAKNQGQRRQELIE